MGEKTYIGDGAYVSWDGHPLKLTTEDGRQVTNTIFLEPEVWAALRRFVARLKSMSASCDLL